MKLNIPLPTAIVVGVVFVVLGVLAWKGVPGTAIAITGAFTSLIAALFKGVQSDAEVVREYSMRPPPNGPGQYMQVKIPSYAPPSVDVDVDAKTIAPPPMPPKDAS